MMILGDWGRLIVESKLKRVVPFLHNRRFWLSPRPTQPSIVARFGLSATMFEHAFCASLVVRQSGRRRAGESARSLRWSVSPGGLFFGSFLLAVQKKWSRSVGAEAHIKIKARVSDTKPIKKPTYLYAGFLQKSDPTAKPNRHHPYHHRSHRHHHPWRVRQAPLLLAFWRLLLWQEHSRGCWVICHAEWNL